MDNLILKLIFLGSLTVTSYRSIPAQTKPNHCHWTSIGERVNNHCVAVSQDLLLSGKIKYGDLVYIESIGFKIVNDTMNKRHTNHIDVWVETYEMEKEFDKRFRNKKMKVWIIKRET